MILGAIPQACKGNPQRVDLGSAVDALRSPVVDDLLGGPFNS